MAYQPRQPYQPRQYEEPAKEPELIRQVGGFALWKYPKTYVITLPANIDPRERAQMTEPLKKAGGKFAPYLRVGAGWQFWSQVYQAGTLDQIMAWLIQNFPQYATAQGAYPAPRPTLTEPVGTGPSIIGSIPSGAAPPLPPSPQPSLSATAYNIPGIPRAAPPAQSVSQQVQSLMTTTATLLSNPTTFTKLGSAGAGGNPDVYMIYGPTDEVDKWFAEYSSTHNPTIEVEIRRRGNKALYLTGTPLPAPLPPLAPLQEVVLQQDQPPLLPPPDSLPLP